jgi:hypothetical protein
VNLRDRHYGPAKIEVARKQRNKMCGRGVCGNISANSLAATVEVWGSACKFEVKIGIVDMTRDNVIWY